MINIQNRYLKLYIPLVVLLVQYGLNTSAMEMKQKLRSSKKSTKRVPQIKHACDYEGSEMAEEDFIQGPSARRSADSSSQAISDSSAAVHCNRFNKVNKKRRKSLNGYCKPLFEGILRSEDDEQAIIDDPSNHLCIKINKILSRRGVNCKIRWARGIKYASRVRNWFNKPRAALVAAYRYDCEKFGINPKKHVPGDDNNKVNSARYTTHRFAKLVDQYLCYGKRIEQCAQGTYRIVIEGSVSDLQQKQWRPCIFEYVIDRRKKQGRRTNECFHRNMRIEHKKSSAAQSEAEVFPAGTCLDDL